MYNNSTYKLEGDVDIGRKPNSNILNNVEIVNNIRYISLIYTSFVVELYAYNVIKEIV